MDVGLHKDLPNGEKGSCRKGKPFLRFSIPLCKGKKGYTPGTEVNKGHRSCAAVNSLPFFIWTEIKANKVILTHSQSDCLIIVKNLVWSLLLPFPVTTLGAIVWRTLTLSPDSSPKSMTIAAGPAGRQSRGRKDRRWLHLGNGACGEVGESAEASFHNIHRSF